MITSLLNLLYDETRRLWYYRWTFAAAAAVIFSGAALYVLQMPDQYDAWAQVLVNKGSPLAAATEGVALAHPDEADPAVVEKLLLSDDSLAPMVRQLRPDAAGMSKAAMAQAVAHLKNKIHVVTDGDDGFIEIHYADTNPVRARNVVRAVVNTFISDSADRNKTALDETATFLDRQITAYEGMLSDSQAKMADFRKQHPGVSNLAIAPLPIDLGDTGSTVVSTPAAASTPVAAAPSAASQRVAQLQSQIANMRTQYTDNYPDVVAAKHQLEIAQAAQSQELASAPTGATTSAGPVRRIIRIRRGHRGIAAPPPEIQAQWQDILRNDEVLRVNYQQLIAKREATRMSIAMYGADGSNKYQVTRAAAVPPAPTGPDRRLYLTLALVAAAAVGLGAAYLRGAISGVFVSPRELEDAFQLPVIGTVSWEPAWDTSATKQRSPLPVIAGAFAAVVLCVAALIAITPLGAVLGGAVQTNAASMLHSAADR